MTDTNLEAANAMGWKNPMEELGITRVITDVFHYRQYRYDRLDHAVAHAMRDQRAVTSYQECNYEGS
jgi:hypothetical protein